MKNSSLLFLFSCFIGSVFVVETAFGQRYVEKKNIPYVEGGGERQQLDLYLPVDHENSGKTYPVLLIIHGGGWAAGDKSHATGWAHHYVPLGYVVVGINYRLQPAHPMPAQIIDCKSAVRWLRTHAKEYKIDPQCFGAWGHSAGGHLSALLGVLGDSKEFDQGEYLDQSSAIQAVCDYCGPADFISWAKNKPEQKESYKNLFGGTLEDKWRLLEKMSPVFNVTKNAAPILIVHAVDDELVPFSQSEELHAAMEKAGAKSRLIALKAGDGGHGARSFNSEENRKIVQQFFEQSLNKTQTSSEEPNVEPNVEPKIDGSRIPKCIIGPPGLEDGRAIRELAAHPEQWEKCRSRIGNILYADHVLNRQFKDDAELTELLAAFRKMNLPIQMEVGAVKPWGRTGKECFDKQQPAWERFLRLGALIDSIAMDEPLNCCDTHLKMENAMEYAAEETVQFIAEVRKKYQDWKIGDIEGFPALTADQMIQWIDLLEKKLKEKEVRGLDFFRIDTDWMHFVHNTGKGSWHDLKRIENHCRNKNIPVSVCYWAANYPAMQRRELADDTTWYVGAMQMGFDYAAVGGTPDQIIVQSWVDGPNAFIPETEPFSFTRSALDVFERFAPKNNVVSTKSR